MQYVGRLFLVSELVSGAKVRSSCAGQNRAHRKAVLARRRRFTTGAIDARVMASDAFVSRKRRQPTRCGDAAGRPRETPRAQGMTHVGRMLRAFQTHKARQLISMSL
jgi:hypothetical protein